MAPGAEALHEAFTITLPTALGDQPLDKDAVSLTQPAGPVTVQSLSRLGASQIDVALVLDTAGAADPRDLWAQQLANAFLDYLPAGVRVAVISTGGGTELLSALGTDRGQTREAVRNAAQFRGYAATDGVALAADVLSARAGRFSHVLLISAGAEDESGQDIRQVRSILDEHRVSLDAVQVGRPGDLPWGEQCPATVQAGEAAAVGALLARRLAATYEVVAAQADPSAPMVVRVRSGAVDVGARLPAAAARDSDVEGMRVERPVSAPGTALWVPVVLGTLGLAVLVGLLRFTPLTVPGGRRVVRHAARQRSHPPVSEPDEPSSPLAAPAAAEASDAYSPGPAPAPSVVGGAQTPDPGPRASEALRREGRRIRGCLISVLFVAVLGRVVLGHGVLAEQDSAPAWFLLWPAALLAVFGGLWLWVATAPPYPMNPGRPTRPTSVDHGGPALAALLPFWVCLVPAALLILLA